MQKSTTTATWKKKKKKKNNNKRRRRGYAMSHSRNFRSRHCHGGDAGAGGILLVFAIMQQTALSKTFAVLLPMSTKPIDHRTGPWAYSQWEHLCGLSPFPLSLSRSLSLTLWDPHCFSSDRTSDEQGERRNGGARMKNERAKGPRGLDTPYPNTDPKFHDIPNAHMHMCFFLIFIFHSTRDNPRGHWK